MAIIKYIDLFCGTGAFSLAMQNTPGTHCVFANDMCPNSEIIYSANFPTHNFVNAKLEHIPVEDVPEHDLLFPGFPCQSFSVEGSKKGFEDDRGQAFFRLLDVIKHRQPKAFVLENVKHLVNHDKGRTFKTITSLLEGEGYIVVHKVLNTATYTDVPQRRERVFIAGFKNEDSARCFAYPEPEPKMRAVEDMLEAVPDVRYYYDARYKIYAQLKRDMRTHKTFYRYKGTTRQFASELCPTLTAGMGGGGHNVPLLLTSKNEIRKLSPRECFNFQTFPATFILPANISDRGQYRLAGNAVSYKVVERLLNNVVRALLGSSDTPSQSVG